MQLTEEQRKAIEWAILAVQDLGAKCMYGHVKALRELLAAHNAGAQEPVATLHDDGCFTWKPGMRPENVCHAGWRMDVFVAQPQPMTDAARDVLAERQRQVEVEGWKPNADDMHDDGEMAMAAACYAESSVGYYFPGTRPETWPWSMKWWKPTTPRRDLVKAGALILAEIERIDRAKGE